MLKIRYFARQKIDGLILPQVYCCAMRNGILNEPVLILNVNFEPLHVTNTKRALSLIFSGKAEIVLNGRGMIRSSTAEFEAPSVIKLGYMVRRPHPRVALSKREVLRRDEFTCQYCGRKMHFLTIDHVVPRRQGGGHSWQNLVAACAQCNRRKGGKRPEEANMFLKRPPFEPRPTAVYRFGQHLSQHEEWLQFMEGW
jgi:5-methylcytosine-specific restriction endonuclease McrA